MEIDGFMVWKDPGKGGSSPGRRGRRAGSPLLPPARGGATVSFGTIKVEILKMATMMAMTMVTMTMMTMTMVTMTMMTMTIMTMTIVTMKP